MNKYFNICLEFDRKKVDLLIHETLDKNEKAYVCVVDGNVLATAHKNEVYRDIINNGLINLCDGSSIALLAGKIHKKNFKTYTGPEFFANFVKENIKQYFVGNTKENLERLRIKLIESGSNENLFNFEPLPFENVDNFDYKEIAKKINVFSPDIIWISLGAPKQEIFISKLYPYIDSGILVAIGAAFNLFLGDNHNRRAPKLLRSMHLEWLYRVLLEPKRVGKRALNYFLLLPQLVFEEIKQVGNNKYDKL
jgi:N-acetylglucosaminyldiphosphoundecaprenol N-acetyl-beta-D-mannosaminyltransferase